MFTFSSPFFLAYMYAAAAPFYLLSSALPRLLSVRACVCVIAVHFAHFIITYSIISCAYYDLPFKYANYVINSTFLLFAALGMGFCNSSFSLALNTYFVVRRNKAAGIAMTITGLGPILLPQLVSLLLTLYGARHCLLIIGALATHIIAGALLLQPVKWHTLPAPSPPPADQQDAMLPCPPLPEVKIVPIESGADDDADEAKEEDEFLEKGSYIDHDLDAQSVYGFELTSQIRQRESFSQPPGGFISAAPRIHRAKSEGKRGRFAFVVVKFIV